MFLITKLVVIYIHSLFSTHHVSGSKFASLGNKSHVNGKIIFADTLNSNYVQPITTLMVKAKYKQKQEK